MEREINTLQFTYLQSWWRHNCVTFHVTKVYFMELKMNIERLYWKTPTFVWIITLVDFFFTFWTIGNRNDYFTKNQQNLQHHPNCVSTLPNVKHHILRRPWLTASWSAFERTRCLQLSSNVHLFYFFLYKLFCQSSGGKSFTFSQVFDQDFIFKLNSKLNIFNAKK